MLIGDCRDIIPELIEAGTRFDSIITDAPYGIGVYGLQWDDEIAFSVDLWRLLHRALKPGGYVAAFAAPRMQHRVTTAIEGAGFTILPPLYWRANHGIPRPINVSELFDRDNLTHRRIVGLTKMSGIAAANQRYGQQQRNGTGLRIKYERHVSREAKHWRGWFYGTNTIKPTVEPIIIAQRPPEGRMIDNLRIHGVGALNVEAIRRNGEWPDPILSHPRVRHGTHPTSKPVSLMEDLVRLLTPPGGHVLDPFAGSGTTGRAAALHGFKCTLIEKDPEFGLSVRQAAE